MRCTAQGNESQACEDENRGRHAPKITFMNVFTPCPPPLTFPRLLCL